MVQPLPASCYRAPAWPARECPAYNPPMRTSTDWRAVLAAAACGVAVALNVGKVPIALPALKRKVVRSFLLDGGGAIELKPGGARGGFEFSLPGAARQPIDTIVVLELDGPAFAAAAG